MIPCSAEDLLSLRSWCGSWHRFWCRPRAISIAALFMTIALILVSIILNENYAAVRRGLVSGEAKKDFNSVILSTTKFLPKKSDNCHDQRHVQGIHSLPKGIIQNNSDLELRPLWSDPSRKDAEKPSKNLLALAVGIMQKENVNRIVQKFLPENFTIMLFHYDNTLDKWHDFQWSTEAIHILAINQTKWWFAKRFLHPDIVVPYKYIFIWDEDIGVENFHVGRYLAIMEEEGLEIAQPALDHTSSEIHHRITIRNKIMRVHRRVYFRGSVLCSKNSKEPPCTGWVESMAPSFSRAAWRCAWHLIQNDLIHGWGMDMKLGYCAQGNRRQKVGVIDSEYIVHQGIPSLGGSAKNKTDSMQSSEASSNVHNSSMAPMDAAFDLRREVRRQAAMEMETFQRRWRRAANQDKCWLDPYKAQKW